MFNVSRCGVTVTLRNDETFLRKTHVYIFKHERRVQHFLTSKKDGIEAVQRCGLALDTLHFNNLKLSTVHLLITLGFYDEQTAGVLDFQQ